MMYTIKKGCHYSWHLPRFHFGKTNMKVRFMFTESCYFPMKEPDDYAINKLCGWGMANHHKNSIRCGWKPSPESHTIELWFYVYSNGQRIEQYFMNVLIGKEYELEMDLSGANVLSFSVRDEEGTTTNSCYFKKPRFTWGASLFPYIGGQLPARTDTSIELSF